MKIYFGTVRPRVLSERIHEMTNEFSRFNPNPISSFSRSRSLSVAARSSTSKRRSDRSNYGRPKVNINNKLRALLHRSAGNVGLAPHSATLMCGSVSFSSVPYRWFCFSLFSSKYAFFASRSFIQHFRTLIGVNVQCSMIYLPYTLS